MKTLVTLEVRNHQFWDKIGCLRDSFLTSNSRERRFRSDAGSSYQQPNPLSMRAGRQDRIESRNIQEYRTKSPTITGFVLSVKKWVRIAQPAFLAVLAEDAHVRGVNTDADEMHEMFTVDVFDLNWN